MVRKRGGGIFSVSSVSTPADDAPLSAPSLFSRETVGCNWFDLYVVYIGLLRAFRGSARREGIVEPVVTESRISCTDESSEYSLIYSVKLHNCKMSIEG